MAGLKTLNFQDMLLVMASNLFLAQSKSNKVGRQKRTIHLHGYPLVFGSKTGDCILIFPIFVYYLFKLKKMGLILGFLLAFALGVIVGINIKKNN